MINIEKFIKYTSINPIVWKKFKKEANEINQTKEILWTKIKIREDKILLKKLFALSHK